jgi:hypothetical protein
MGAPRLQHSVGTALVRATHVASPTQAQLASAFDALSGRLRARLQTLFGDVAVSALAAKALRAASVQFGWLTEVVPNDVDSASAPSGLAILGGLDAAVVRDGFSALLAHEIDLLTGFVGEDLALPLLQQAWGTATAAERGVDG